MMFGSGYYGSQGCFGNGYIGSGWHFLIIGGILLLVAATVIYLSRRNTHGQGNNDALEMLKLKYVQGEITEEEYLTRKNTLNRK